MKGFSRADRPLPFSRPRIGEEEIAEVVETLRSGWITSGPRVRRFEEDFARFVGSSHAIAVASASGGLLAALRALGTEPGTEVVTTPMTFVATVNAIELLGAKPVFADVDEDTLLLDPAEAKARVGASTVGFLPVHFAGQPVDLDAFGSLASERDLFVLEDAAHALGAAYRGRPIGSGPNAAVFSFHPVKNITTGEGGMVVTPDADLARRLARLRFHGIDRDAWARRDGPAGAHGDVVEPGYKLNLTDLQAAIGIHQLRRLEAMNEARRRLARRYDERFAEVEEIRALADVSYPFVHARHLYVVRLELERLTVDRDEVLARLGARGIGVAYHYRAIHLHSHYARRYGLARGDFPRAEAASDSILSLPLFPTMSDADVDDVVQALVEVLRDVRA